VVLDTVIVEKPAHPVFIAPGPARVDDDPVTVGNEPVDILFGMPFQVADGRIPFGNDRAVKINREDKGSHA